MAYLRDYHGTAPVTDTWAPWELDDCGCLIGREHTCDHPDRTYAPGDEPCDDCGVADGTHDMEVEH